MFSFRLGNVLYLNVTLNEMHKLFEKETEKQYAGANK
ncbi:hypothetical protein MUDAN_MDHGFNIF_02666 [Lactiplantibacillus mudanjiangensis]|uniref:Uncharacterized protein n=1 Tax=Lactiplantibacillus mudanjiangensis TaxID=1296538 RepID=A0A660E4H4_9LACO|nr:hypothetical protein MUDAN_IGPPGNFN_02237 [Lactiplantibacillus mudanjiangensis]VDG27843.1 hypothetical protein MUDAN_MDHGFNIF_02666 [Lactiplantibacillus mudanjiangensis]